jgi:hypothetical protein
VFLVDVFARTITQVQATQRPYATEQTAHEYIIDATEELESRLSYRNLSMEECIRFVKDKKANPNAHQKETLTLLAEAILSRCPEALPMERMYVK